MHYDSGTAQSMGFRTAFAEGPMETAFLCQLLTNWMGVTGILKKISVTYREMVFTGDTLTCQGKITNKYREGDENFVELELKAVNQDEQITIYGKAVVTLPLSEKKQQD